MYQVPVHTDYRPNTVGRKSGLQKVPQGVKLGSPSAAALIGIALFPLWFFGSGSQYLPITFRAMQRTSAAAEAVQNAAAACSVPPEADASSMMSTRLKKGAGAGAGAGA